jgi:succinate dehydrogenase / fumarate reductase cytochrome b subunit
MSDSDRPLSPHISIYRWPVTMALSILHRATGVAMSVGLVVFAVWLMQTAAGPQQYAEFSGLMSSLLGKLALIGWSYAFFFHLGNGVRHLFWDAGYGFEKQQTDASAWFVLVISILLTVAFWLVLP